MVYHLIGRRILSYMVTSFLKVVSPDSEFVETLIMILALPMTIGELGLAIWLWIKVEKGQHQKTVNYNQ